MDPVIVVGAGPVGLSLALALAGSGVPSVVLDEGPGKDLPRPARTVVLHEDTSAMVHRLGCTTLRDEGALYAAWRTLRRRGRADDAPRTTFEDRQAPLHLPQHALARGLRDSAGTHPLIQLVTDSKLDSLEQDDGGITAHTRGAETTWWRGSYLVGCDGARSTVRKLLGIRFPGRTAVERHAVAALRTELPWPGEALLHRDPPRETTARPLPDGVWRLDWLLPACGELVTPDALVTLIRDTLAAWCGGTTPPYELLDTGVHTLHHRLARRWRERRAFLAGDAAHLLGALGTQGVDEGLRDAENLAWKLSLAWHQGGSEALLDSYEDERRTAVAARLRAADQAMPVLRGGGGLRTYLPGATRSGELLLTDGHLGRGPLGAAPTYAPPVAVREVPTDTEPGGQVANVPVTAPDGSTVPLRDLLGRGRPLVVLVAPGTGVWDRRHWLGAGLMPRLAAAVSALPVRTELLVADGYPGAPAHTVLLIRPDGHLAATFAGVRPAELYEAADALRCGAPESARAELDPPSTTPTTPTHPAVID
ncbi:FAD-dependent monooxygenase [Streptomyces roseus]|uniref:Monooxygenase n=1 Tax=Streptomyces roseus TaxID=66430 RepID=A0A0J6XMI2_9ACTN|nr:FAD-dependent monooxygenase [Streptomyces roseus]KMO96409.1 monooxygenase [Streptomyces roseus]